MLFEVNSSRVKLQYAEVEILQAGCQFAYWSSIIAHRYRYLICPDYFAFSLSYLG